MEELQTATANNGTSVGIWTYRAGKISSRWGQAIDIERLDTLAKILNYLAHVESKAVYTAEEVGDLVRLLDRLLGLQSVGAGADEPVAEPRLRADEAAALAPPEHFVARKSDPQHHVVRSNGPMLASQAHRLVVKLLAAFPASDFSDESCKLYASKLRMLKYGAGSNAIDTLIERNTTMPTIAEILATAREIESWEAFL